MIDAYSSLGLVEISGVAATVDNRETGRVNPQARALEAVRYDSMHIPDRALQRHHGRADRAPSGGVVAGVACLLRLDGWTNREMAVDEAAAMMIELLRAQGAGGVRRGGRGRAGLVDGPGILAASAACSRRPGPTRSGATRAKDLRLAPPEFDETSEALRPLLKGEIPAMISVHSERDIKAAIEFVRDEKLKAVFYGAEQGFVAGSAKAAIPVVLGSMNDLPAVWEDGYDAVFRNLGLLAKAGVTIAFSSSSASAAKDLPYHAAKAPGLRPGPGRGAAGGDHPSGPHLRRGQDHGQSRGGESGQYRARRRRHPRDGPISSRSGSTGYNKRAAVSPSDLSNRYIGFLDKFKKQASKPGRKK
ncbi:MAG: hypothetical protein MZV64_11785 [Ignavibacteriales bacterium]|nr:hypothetical protein [Ignavibacteriales bacterium]